MEIDIIILFYNKVDQTISCVNSFLFSGQRIYILNNGSDLAQLNKLKNTYEGNSQVFILDAGKNLGVSGGRNYLLENTNSPWIFSVDNDIVILNTNNWVVSVEQFCIQNPDVRIITPLLYNVHESEYSLNLNVHVDDNKMRIVTGKFSVSNCFPGGAAIIHKSIFEKYGLFDDGMFVGFEDYEFALRALLSGFGQLQVYSVDTIELIHDHKFQKNIKDKLAVKERYNKDKMKASFDRLTSKYNIEFDHDWLNWTGKQVEDMTTPKFWQKVKRKLKSLLGQ
jgi:GT2 family glycosyltransferase